MSKYSDLEKMTKDKEPEVEEVIEEEGLEAVGEEEEEEEEAEEETKEAAQNRRLSERLENLSAAHRRGEEPSPAPQSNGLMDYANRERYYYFFRYAHPDGVNTVQFFSTENARYLTDDIWFVINQIGRKVKWTEV